MIGGEIKFVRDTCLEDALRIRLWEAEEIIKHVVYSTQDSQNLAYEYLEKYGLLRIQFKADGKTLDIDNN